MQSCTNAMTNRNIYVDNRDLEFFFTKLDLETDVRHIMFSLSMCCDYVW